MNLWILNGDNMEQHCRDIKLRLETAATKEDKQVLTIINDFLTEMKRNAIKINDHYEDRTFDELLGKRVKEVNGKHE